jgi:hypothetical protein
VLASLLKLSTTADMVVVDLEAARLPDANAVAALFGPSAAHLASVGWCLLLLLLNLPEAQVHAVQVAGVPAVALPADGDPGWTRPRRPAVSPW